MDEVDHGSDIAVYLQVAAIIRDRIASGDLPPRRAVPSKRTLRQEYGVSGGSVDRAMAVLRAEGLIRTVKGKGLFVTDPAERGNP